MRAPTPELFDDQPDDPQSDQPSKTARKKQMHALQQLGERIVALTPEHTAGLALPERLVEAVELARRIRAHEGRRRQMQYIGRLMRDVDASAIEAAIDALQRGHRVEVAQHHEAESWRDRLLDDEAAVTDLVTAYTAADVQRLRQLRRQAIREPANPRHRREIYRVVLEAIAASHSQDDNS